MNIKKCLVCVIVWLLCGCAVSPPKPPQPEGTFRPVNAKPCDTQGEVQP